MSKKIKAVKAVLMWGNFYENGKRTEIIVHPDEMNARVTALSCGESKPVAVIPIDDMPALVIQIARYVHIRAARTEETWDKSHPRERAEMLAMAQHALESIGIAAGKRRAKK